MYEIEFTFSAEEDLKVFRKFEQMLILDGIEENLRYVPAVATPNKKRL